uniref:DNA maturase B n=1 Tax=uncultured marine virus TaxID=186617 RepID=A0A0F7L865_9VIRU|nr:DNA maturase B [uncultured marine virus]
MSPPSPTLGRSLFSLSLSEDQMIFSGARSVSISVITRSFIFSGYLSASDSLGLSMNCKAYPVLPYDILRSSRSRSENLVGSVVVPTDSFVILSVIKGAMSLS